MRVTWKRHNISLETKIRHLRCYVFSILLYGNVVLETHNKTESIWNVAVNRKLLRISLTANVTNKNAQKNEKRSRSLTHHQEEETANYNTRESKRLTVLKLENLVWEKLNRTISICYKQSHHFADMIANIRNG